MGPKGILAIGLAFAIATGGCAEKGARDSEAAANDSGATTVAEGGSGASAVTSGQAADPDRAPVDGDATLSVAPTAVAGAEVTVAWTGPGNGSDYIDIVPRGFMEVRGEINYSYVKSANPSVTLRAPTTAGDYDVRYVLELGTERKVKAVAPLTVAAGEATLEAPAAVTGGDAISVAWTGPDGRGDYIDIVKSGVRLTSGEITYAYTSAGSPAKLEAPGAAGDYDIRYVLEGPDGRKIVATSKLSVAAASAQLDAPAMAAKGLAFKVDWTGPRSSGDYVDLVKKGHSATSGEIDYFYVGQGDSGELTAPEAGEYEIRYILEAPGGRSVVAKRAIRIS